MAQFKTFLLLQEDVTELLTKADPAVMVALGALFGATGGRYLLMKLQNGTGSLFRRMWSSSLRRKVKKKLKGEDPQFLKAFDRLVKDFNDEPKLPTYGAMMHQLQSSGSPELLKLWRDYLGSHNIWDLKED